MRKTERMASILQLEFDGQNLSDSEFRKTLMLLLKENNIPIQRGHLVQDAIQTSQGWAAGPKSRKLIWDGKELLELDVQTLGMPVVPRDFSCPFEFALDHWSGLTSIDMVWLELEPIRGDLIRNHSQGSQEQTSAMIPTSEGKFQLLVEDIRNPRGRIASFSEILRFARVIPVLNSSAFARFNITVPKLQPNQVMVGMVGY